jgi:hypothetical protein
MVTVKLTALVADQLRQMIKGLPPQVFWRLDTVAEEVMVAATDWETEPVTVLDTDWDHEGETVPETETVPVTDTDHEADAEEVIEAASMLAKQANTTATRTSAFNIFQGS